MAEQTETDTVYKEYPICRTCLNVIRTTSYRLQENSGCGEGLKISHVLRYIVPELYLGLSNSPEICGNCRESLRVAYTFRKLCLETETMIGNYLKNVRCTAQVIDLGAVIGYLSNMKMQQNAQKIMSDWQDESCENPLASESSSHNKIPISNFETLKSAVATVKQLTHNTTSGLIQLNNLQKTTTDENSEENLKKTEHLKFDKTSGYYVNECGKKFHIKGQKALPLKTTEGNIKSDQSTSKEIHVTEKVLVNKQAKTNCEETKGQKALPKERNTKTYQNKSKETRITERMILPKPTKPNCEETKGQKVLPIITKERNTKTYQIKSKEIHINEKILLPKQSKTKFEEINDPEEPLPDDDPFIDEIGKTINIDDLDSEEILNPHHLTICEETGLMKNNQGEYFNFDGTPVDKEQVDAEKLKAKVVGESLFTISNICTVSDDDFIDAPNPPPLSKTDEEEKIPVSLIRRDEKQASVYQVSNEEITKENYPLLISSRREYVGNISVKKTSDLQNPSAQTAGILPNLLEKPQRRYDRTCYDKVPPLTPISSHGSMVLNPFMNTAFQSISDSNIPPAIEKPKSNILNFEMNKNLRLPDTPVFRLRTELNKKSGRTNDHSIPNKPSNILDFLPNQDNLNDSFTVHTFDTSNDGIDNLMRVIKEEPLDFDFDNSIGNDSEDTLSVPDTGDWTNFIRYIDDPTNNYVDIPEFVKINNVTMTDLEALKNEHLAQAEVDNGMDNLLDTEKIIEPPIITPSEDKTLWDSLPERFPYNGKMLIKCDNYYKYEDELGEQSIQSGKKQVRRRRRLKIVPVEENQVAKPPNPKKQREEHPDREMCVLITSYTSDGFYVNDHDYLIAPYVRNKILIEEGANLFCMCFICGIKHDVKEHVAHMLKHPMICPVCGINMGTSYMLNLHMKSHVCKKCPEVTTPILTDHSLLQKNQEEKVVENDYDEDEYELQAPIRRKATVKSCFVPVCTNTSKNSSKIFIYISKANYVNWFKAVGRIRIPTKQTQFWCCEDHFDMKEDCINWLQYKLMKVKLKMKKNVLPHKCLSTSLPPSKYYSQRDEYMRDIGEENLENLEIMEKKLTALGEDLDSQLSESDSDDDKTVNFQITRLPPKNQKILRSRSIRRKESESKTDFDSNIKTEPEDSTEISSNKKTDKFTPIITRRSRRIVKPPRNRTDITNITANTDKNSKKEIINDENVVKKIIDDGNSEKKISDDENAEKKITNDENTDIHIIAEELLNNEAEDDEKIIPDESPENENNDKEIIANKNPENENTDKTIIAVEDENPDKQIIPDENLVWEIEDKNTDKQIIADENLVLEIEDKNTDNKIITDENLVREIEDKNTDNKIIPDENLVRKIEDKNTDNKIIADENLVLEIEDKNTDNKIIADENLVLEIEEKNNDNKIIVDESLEDKNSEVLIEVKKTEDVSENKVTRGKKRKRWEVECLDEQELTKTRVLRTRVKKPVEEDTSEGSR